jgi:hypothetical protein
MSEKCEAVLGNVGSSDRIDYTAIGDNVNISARRLAINLTTAKGLNLTEPPSGCCCVPTK